MELDWSLPRLLHVYGKDREPDAAELVRIAESDPDLDSIREDERFAKLIADAKKRTAGAPT